jgi:hypothetical protein
MMDGMVHAMMQQFSDWHGPFDALIHIFDIAEQVCVVERGKELPIFLHCRRCRIYWA